MSDQKFNPPTKKKASLTQAWIKNDLREFSLAVANLENYHISAAIKLIDNNISYIFKGEKFELFKILVSWIYSSNEKNKISDGLINSFEKKIFTNYIGFQIKSKNIHYLNFCSLFLKSNNISNLGGRFSIENWVEGWTLFTKENLNKMPENIKLSYLKNTFLHLNHDLLIEIENMFDAKTINAYISDIQKQTPNQFWISEISRKIIFSDEEKVFLLKFSEKYGHCISEKMKNNLLPFINKHSPKTIFYIIEKTSCEFIRKEIYPDMEQWQIKNQKINPSFRENFAFLKQCMLESQLIEKTTNSSDKKVKL